MIEYYPLKYGHGYWVVDNLDHIINFDSYKETILNCLPYKNNPCNPFLNIHIEQNQYTKQIYEFVKHVYKTKVNSSVSQTNEFLSWGNIYDKNSFSCSKFSLIPHIDSYKIYDGIVGNIWISERIETSGTNLYHYHGNIIKTIHGYKFDFMIDKSHPRFQEYHQLKDQIITQYNNFDWGGWGFEYIGIAPSKYNTMTLYKINTPHTAFIPNGIDYRVGCSYLYSSFSPILI